MTKFSEHFTEEINMPEKPERAVTPALRSGERRRRTFGALLASSALAIFLAAACAPAGPEITTGQLMLEFDDVINNFQIQQEILQDQIDSLRLEMLAQDSLIRHIANLTGNPMPPRAVVTPF